MKIATKKGKVSVAKRAFGDLFNGRFDGKNYCSYCGKDSAVVVEIEAEDGLFTLCEHCLKAAQKRMESYFEARELREASRERCR